MVELIYDLKEIEDGVFIIDEGMWPSLKIDDKEVVLLKLGELDQEVKNDVEGIIIEALLKNGRKVVKTPQGFLFTRKGGN